MTGKIKPDNKNKLDIPFFATKEILGSRIKLWKAVEENGVVFITTDKGILKVEKAILQ